MKKSAASSVVPETALLTSKVDPRLIMAFFMATASSVYVVENLLLRMLPIPFFRLGLSYTLILYLLYRKMFWQAFAINLLKPLIGGILTLNLASPAVLLSLGGGTAAVITLALLIRQNIGFSIYGVSILGALSHNLTQLFMVRHLIIITPDVYKLIPVMIGMSLISGLIVAYIAGELDEFLSKKLTDKNL